MDDLRLPKHEHVDVQKQVTYANTGVPVVLQAWSLWRSTWRLYVAALPFKLVNDASQFVGPFFLNLLLATVSAGAPAMTGYSYAVLMLVLLEIGSLADGQHFQLVMRAGAGPSPLMWTKESQNVYAQKRAVLLMPLCS